jgi:hypothetical protein
LNIQIISISRKFLFDYINFLKEQKELLKKRPQSLIVHFSGLKNLLQ